MTYAIYHIPGVKIGVTNNIKHRVEEQQGYSVDEYEILEMSEDIDYISKRELYLQERYGYRVDRQLYKDLFNNNFIELNNMDINVTEMTTTFPCPVNKLKGRLMDNLGKSWETAAGPVMLTLNHHSILAIDAMYITKLLLDGLITMMLSLKIKPAIQLVMTVAMKYLTALDHGLNKEVCMTKAMLKLSILS
jgi:hypothetical protein